MGYHRATKIHAKETNKTGSMIIRKIPDDIRRLFKAKCATDGISQQDKIIDFIKTYVGNKS